MIWNNELYHYGMPRRSGRYKYGSGLRPYQHAKGYIKNRMAEKKADKIKQRKQAQKDELKTLRRKEHLRRTQNITLSDKDKKFLMETGNVQTITKYRNQFTDKELETVLRRANTEKNLSKISQEQINAGKRVLNRYLGKRISRYSKGVSTTVDNLKNFEKGYNYARHLAGKNKR